MDRTSPSRNCAARRSTPAVARNLGLLQLGHVSATNLAISQNTYTLLSRPHASANQAVVVSQS